MANLSIGFMFSPPLQSTALPELPLRGMVFPELRKRPVKDVFRIHYLCEKMCL